MSTLLYSVHREAFKAAAGSGWHQSFAGVSVADANFIQMGGSKGARFEYGQNEYMIGRNRTGGVLAAGDIVKYRAALTGTITAATKAVLTTDQTYTVNEHVGKILFITAGTGIGQMRRIIANSGGANATITVAQNDGSLGIAAISTPDAFGTLPVNTDTYEIICPWEIVKHAAATDFIIGAALGDVADGEWTIFQTKGIALVSIVGSTDATTAGGPVVPSATAGIAKGPTGAGITASEASRVFGIAWDAYNSTAALRPVTLLGKYLR
jgi:hypothetical protein